MLIQYTVTIIVCYYTSISNRFALHEKEYIINCAMHGIGGLQHVNKLFNIYTE